MLERSELHAVLEESAALGFLGPGSLASAMAHAAAFGVWVPAGCASVVDLGSGGGLPGLVLASLMPETQMVLLDASLSRTDFLRRAVGRLGWNDRVRVVTGRAEVLGRSSEWRSSQDAVVSRGFGPPALTAECGAPFLRVGGRLVVSEPPEPDPGRWPPDPLALLGLEQLDLDTDGLAVFEQRTPCPSRFPRHSLRRPLY